MFYLKKNSNFIKINRSDILFFHDRLNLEKSSQYIFSFYKDRMDYIYIFLLPLINILYTLYVYIS